VKESRKGQYHSGFAKAGEDCLQHNAADKADESKGLSTPVSNSVR